MLVMRLYLGRFSPDGSILASQDRSEGNVWLWDVNSGTLLATLPSRHFPIWSRNGRFLAMHAGGWFTWPAVDDQPESAQDNSSSPTKEQSSLSHQITHQIKINSSSSHFQVHEVVAPARSYRLPARVQAPDIFEGRQSIRRGWTRVWDVLRMDGRLQFRPRSFDQRGGRYVASAGAMWYSGYGMPGGTKIVAEIYANCS